MHEYSILSHPRERIIYYISLLAIALAPLLTANLSYIHNIFSHSLLNFTISTSLAFTALYWLFSKFIWRLRFINKVLAVPNLNGTWKCVGKSIDKLTGKNLEWQGSFTITQNWQKIMITLTTQDSQSLSVSIMGGLKQISGAGFILGYSYENKPKSTITELKPHTGYCQIHFNEQLTKATGAYYNDENRSTFGSLELRKA